MFIRSFTSDHSLHSPFYMQNVHQMHPDMCNSTDAIASKKRKTTKRIPEYSHLSQVVKILKFKRIYFFCSKIPPKSKRVKLCQNTGAHR